MIDPVSTAHLGFFTYASENNYPITTAHLGYFVFGGDVDEFTGVGGESGTDKLSPIEIRILELERLKAQDEFLTKRQKANREKEIESKFPDVSMEEIAKGIPISLNALSLSKITDDIEREIAGLIRHIAIQDHAIELREQIEDDKLFEEELMITIALINGI